MTYSLLLTLLKEAQCRRDNKTLPADVRDRSAETVALCEERMLAEGIDYQELERLAKSA